MYAVSCWSNWWYAASFSQRSLIQIYPVLAIPIGYFFLSFKRKSKLSKILLSVFILAFISLNLFQSWQYSNGIIDNSRMTWPYYHAIFGKTKATQEDKKLLLVDRHDFNPNIPIDTNRFKLIKKIKPNIQKANYQNNTALEEYDSLVIDDEFFEILDVPVTQITNEEYAIVQVSFTILPVDTFNENQFFLVTHQWHHDKMQAYRAFDLSKENLYFDKWNYRKFNYITPEFKGRKDNFVAYIYNPAKKKFLLSNIEINIYEHKN